MSAKKLSRNAPCPCGSGKKYKHCCLNKGIDWEAQQANPARRMLPGAPRPRPTTSQGLAALGPFRVIDARLKEIVRASQGAGDWKGLVEALSEKTADAERIRAYKAVRQAGVLPPDAASFLFGHAIQWMPLEEEGNDLDRQMLAGFRRFGLDDIADLYNNDRLAYDRQYERGRQFFFGPPDEMLARRLRERGIID